MVQATAVMVPCCSSQAVHWGIDELKAVVPIWKKEFFEDGSQVGSAKALGKSWAVSSPGVSMVSLVML